MCEVLSLREHVYGCIQCGVCSAVCPVVDLMDLEPRRLIGLLVDNGCKLSWVPESLRVCTGCFLCSDRCPQDVPVAEIFRDLREESLTTGHSSTSLGMTDLSDQVMKQVIRYGRIYDIPVLTKTSIQAFSTSTFDRKDWKQFQQSTRIKIRKKNIAGIKEIDTLLKHLEQNTNNT